MSKYICPHCGVDILFEGVFAIVSYEELHYLDVINDKIFLNDGDKRRFIEMVGYKCGKCDGNLSHLLRESKDGNSLEWDEDV
jgi:DNA-directed RNA polymerase subunit RPC12/RpoP